MKQNSLLILVLALFLLLVACSNPGQVLDTGQMNPSFHSEEESSVSIQELDPDGYYYELEEVVAYLREYGQLPINYITKQEARDLDWQIDDGSGLVIGGDPFGNREGLLPDKKGRQYYEADLVEGYSHHRGPSRLVFSNDGLIYYTNDHYESFEKIN